MEEDDKGKLFAFRHGLYKISNRMSDSDVEKIKFMLSDFLPRQQLEKARTAFDVFCLMSTREDLLSQDDFSFLEEVLQEVGKRDCVRSCFSTAPTTSYDVAPSLTSCSVAQHQKPKLPQIKKFLGELSDSLSADNIRDLSLFFAGICESINYQNARDIQSGEQLFSKLQESHLLGVGVTQLQPLRHVFVLIGRLDLATSIDNYISGAWESTHLKMSLSTPEEQAPSENFYTPSTGSLIQTDSSQPDPVLSTHQLLSKIVEQDNHLDRQQKEIEKLHSKLDEDRGKEIQSLRGELRKKIDEVNSLCGQLAKLQEILWTKNDVPLYDMVRVPHGLAIVIANEKFDSDPQKPHVSLKQRKGAIKDAELFAQTFGFLNYKVKLHRDLSSDSMRSLVSRVANLDHSEFDSFVCCVSSHGNQTGIYGSNGVVLHRSLFIDPIKSNTSLLGKPKLFFFQACRVANVEVDSPELYPPDPIAPILHVDCDVLIANASTEGNPAYTSPASGSWFADALQQTLTNPQSVYSLTLQQMLEKVTNMISQAAGRLSGGEEVVKQCMEVTTRMRKGIKFFTSV